jgi:phosphoribosylglycinamide formyltransferase-1
VRLAVFASGSGTTFAALADAAARGALGTTEVALLVTDRPDAGATARAEKRGIETARTDPGADDHAASLLRLLDAHAIDFVALAGYLRKVPPPVVEAFRERMLNTHPALLPAFGGQGMYGGRVHAAVLDYGARWTGATIHLVEEEYDTGPVVLQQPVPVRPGDTPETLAERVQHVERRLYPEAVRLFAEGRVTVRDRRVTIDDDPLAPQRRAHE